MLFLLTSTCVFLTAAHPDPWNIAPFHHAEGVRMAVALMAILLTHEMGHYVACRLYGIDATLPFFIPAWFINPLVGTFGAVIRIKSPFPHRRALFDVGLAGPLAGFAVCLPVLVMAMFEARVVPDSAAVGLLPLGDPLFFTLAFNALRSAPPPGYTITLGPLGQAAWFGLFVTGLNLLPVGQLDGGHAVYALFRRRAHLVARAVWWTCVGLIVIGGPSWILWAILVRFIGITHPPTLDDAQPLGRGRAVVAVIALLVFVGCFLPQPIPFSWAELWHELHGLFTSN